MDILTDAFANLRLPATRTLENLSIVAVAAPIALAITRSRTNGGHLQ